mmetsp:Transcript_38640/g.92424  ORF Transcript_38640/g.92424 Transcript_38640/m.92424 type:complete len:299 (+) Transcript_38640:1139-2035(+)
MSTAVLPSQNARHDASGPVMKDSTTQVSPAAPKALSDMISLTAARVSSCVVGRRTPLPAARPDALTTWRSDGSSDLTYAMASSAEVKFRYLAVGMSCSWRKSFVKALLASSSAAALLGPKTLTSGHAAASSSATPSTSGCSGPTTTIAAPTLLTSPTTVALSHLVIGLPSSSVAFEIFPPSFCVPPFPGRTMTSETKGLLARATARACSRPPLPSKTTVSDLGPDTWPAASASSLDRADSAALASRPRSSASPDAAREARSAPVASGAPRNDPEAGSYATTRTPRSGALIDAYSRDRT